MSRLLRLNILIYTYLLIFQHLFLGIVNNFIYLFEHIILDLFDYIYIYMHKKIILTLFFKTI